VENRSHVDLPPGVVPPFEVYLNGVVQTQGVDFDVVGRTLVFNRELAREGPLGFWRWARMALGIAGSYRKNDSIDVVYAAEGKSVVASLVPRDPRRHLDE
jgi:hypothetical protein